MPAITLRHMQGFHTVSVQTPMAGPIVPTIWRWPHAEALMNLAVTFGLL